MTDRNRKDLEDRQSLLDLETDALLDTLFPSVSPMPPPATAVTKPAPAEPAVPKEAPRSTEATSITKPAPPSAELADRTQGFADSELPIPRAAPPPQIAETVSKPREAEPLPLIRHTESLAPQPAAASHIGAERSEPAVLPHSQASATRPAQPAPSSLRPAAPHSTAPRAPASPLPAQPPPAPSSRPGHPGRPGSIPPPKPASAGSAFSIPPPRRLDALVARPAPVAAAKAAEPEPRTEERRSARDSAPELSVRGLVSLPPPSSSRQSLWPDERPALAHANEQLLKDKLEERAAWIEQEAQALEDPAAKTRALLVASEIWALVGDVERGRQALQQAPGTASYGALTRFQARGLASVAGDWESAVQILDQDIQAGANAELRSHAAVVAHEICRKRFDDSSGAFKRLEIMARTAPEDLRVHVLRLARELSDSSKPVQLRLPNTPEFAPLNQAIEQLNEFRGAKRQNNSSGTTYAFNRVKQALTENDLEAAALALLELAQIPELNIAARWLAAALNAGIANVSGALQIIAGINTDKPSSKSTRAELLLRMQEQDFEWVRRWLNANLSSNAVSGPEKAALVVLTFGAEQATNGEIQAVAELTASPQHRPLLAAARAAFSTSLIPEIELGTASDRVSLALGRELAETRLTPKNLDTVAPLLADLEAAAPGHPLARLLNLEIAYLGQKTASVAAGLAKWPIAKNDSDRETNRQLLAGLLYELVGDRESAQISYRQALDVDPRSEAAARALLADAAPIHAANILAELAESLSGSAATSWLLLEAAMRRGKDDPEAYEQLIDRVFQLAPDSLLVIQLGEEFAREQANTQKLLAWLTRRKAHVQDSFERALILVRESLLLTDFAPEQGAQVLGEAIAMRPRDIALRELHERLAEAVDRAAWREECADQLEGSQRGTLLLEAAFEYERAGKKSDAVRTAWLALEQGGISFGQRLAERLASPDQLAAWYNDQIRNTDDPETLRNLHERLTDLAQRQRGSTEQVVHQLELFRLAPDNLVHLFGLSLSLARGMDNAKLAPVAERIATLLSCSEGNAHARLAAELFAHQGNFARKIELAALVASRTRAPLWGLEFAYWNALISSDAALAVQHGPKLYERLRYPLDRATVAYRAAQAALLLGQHAEAKDLLEKGLGHIPNHWLILRDLSETYVATAEYGKAAKTYEAVAQGSFAKTHQVAAFARAGVLWLDFAGDKEQAERALEEALALDPTNEDALERLQALYVQQGASHKLARLLELRLQRTTDPEERIALEVARSRALSAVGEHAQARAALTAALDENPGHLEALDAFAALASNEGDFAASEQALIRLARHAIEPKKQADVYRRLGELYDTVLPNPNRAELAYREVLKREPEDTGSQVRLVSVFARLGDADGALQLQNQLYERAKAPEEKRDNLIQLAILTEQLNRDMRQAESLFEKARKDFPYDNVVLRALADHLGRTGQAKAQSALLGRSGSDARRALGTGRFELSFFEMLATISELKGETETATITQSAILALRGQTQNQQGLGLNAVTSQLDELLAPDLLNSALRNLLRKSGTIIDMAYPISAANFALEPVEHSFPEFANTVRKWAFAFGLRNIHANVSPSLGPLCLPVASNGRELILGKPLLDREPEPVVLFLLVRSLKLLQANASSLSRLLAVDLWPVFAAYLSLFVPDWTPQGVDAKRFTEAKQRLQAVLPDPLDDDVPVLALEVIGFIGSRASQLATALNQWANRVALLAVGDLTSAFRAIAIASGHPEDPPKTGPERIRWAARNPEARDLAVFSVSEQYADARARAR